MFAWPGSFGATEAAWGLLAGRNVARTGIHQLNQAVQGGHRVEKSLEREYVGARRAPQKSTTF